MSQSNYDRFLPKIDQFAGNKEEIEKMQINLTKKIPTLLVGPPGIGKTSSIIATCIERKIQLIEINASMSRDKDSLKDYLTMCRSYLENPVVILFDEVDGMEKSGAKTIELIIKHSRYAVIFTANDLKKVPSSISSKCEIIKYKTPPLTEIVARIKQIGIQEGIEPHYERVHGDVRNSIISSIYNVDGTGEQTIFQEMENFFMNNTLPREVNHITKIWIMENIPNFYKRSKIYEAENILAIADRTNPIVLKYLPPDGRGKVAVPGYFKKNKQKIRLNLNIFKQIFKFNYQIT